MPVLVEPDRPTVTSLLKAMPPGAHGVSSIDRMQAWLDQHPDEYVVVLGPDLDLDDAHKIAEDLRSDKPTVSVVLVVATLDTQVLTRAMKAGARDVVQADDMEAISSAVRQAHQLFVALRGPSGAKSVGRVVTIFSPKGGVGKTTVAVNLSLALCAGGARKVCLVDLDLAFGDVAITMQLFPTHSIEQAIGSEDTLDLPMVEALLTRHENSMMVLAAPPHPDIRERVTPALVSRLLRTLKEGYDFVVVDTAPAFDDQVLTALDETDECVLVATLDVPTLKNVKVALETLEMLNIASGHRHLLLNRADDAVGISSDKVEAILGMPVSTAVASSIAVAAATNAGTPIVIDQPEHGASSAIIRLAALLTGDEAPTPTADEQGRTEESSDRGRRMFRRKKETPT